MISQDNVRPYLILAGHKISFFVVFLFVIILAIMTYQDNVYWLGSYFHVLVMIVFLVNIWRTKSCSGVSLKSQFLYALVFTIRHQDLVAYNVPVANAILKSVYLIVTYGTVLSILMYFPKTYEKQNDEARIDLWIVACFLLGLFLNDRFDFLEVLTSFSIYLETIAMIPQFQFIFKTQRIDKSVILYLAAMTIYSVLYVAFFAHQYRTRPYRNHFRFAAAAIQLLLYCDFFNRIYPLMNFQENDEQTVESNCNRFGKNYCLPCFQHPKGIGVENKMPTKDQLG